MGEAKGERFRGSGGHVGVRVLEAEEERGADGEAGGVGGRGEAAEGERGAVDARGEGGGGVDEEGDELGGAVVEGGEPKGSAVVAIGCTQRQRVLADQELDNGGVAVFLGSPTKDRVPTAVRVS